MLSHRSHFTSHLSRLKSTVNSSAFYLYGICLILSEKTSIMKIVLDIPDDKIDFMMELFNNLPFVKAEPEKSRKQEIMDGLRDAVKEVKLAEEGKIKLQSARDFLNEI